MESSFTLLSRIDHLIYAVPDLEVGILDLENRTGVQAILGGQHKGFGTWNALLSLGQGIYLEIIAPDPQQPGSNWFNIDPADPPKLMRWVANSDQLENEVASAKANGFDIGEIFNGNRVKPDGSLLTWQLTNPLANPGDGLIPFFIDWQDSQHPSMSTPQGCVLLNLKARHPKPISIQKKLSVLALNLQISLDEVPQLIATIQTPKGKIELM